MFLTMLNEESKHETISFFTRLRFAVRRMRELEDSQIVVASCVVAGRSNRSIKLRREANDYLSGLYSLYRWSHLRIAAKMLLYTLGMRPRRPPVYLLTFILWSAVRARGLWASVCRRVFPVNLNVQDAVHSC